MIAQIRNIAAAAAMTVVIPIGIASCAGTHSKDASMNQLPVNVQMAAIDHIGDGHVKEVEVKTRKGLRWYEFEYEKNNQKYDLSLDEQGKVMEKEKD